MLEYQLAICERQEAEAPDGLVKIVLVALEQQHIAGLEADIAQPAVDRAALTGQGKQIDLPVSPELQGRRGPALDPRGRLRSEEHTSELQSLMHISYAVFCLKKKNK